MATETQIFKVVKEPFEHDPTTIHEYATTLDGHYIGDIKNANYLMIERGIQPELTDPSYNVCSIGFCKKEQKWYGWSHRAMFGFGIGSEVKKGDCAYVPSCMQDAIEDAVSFHRETDRVDVTAVEAVDVDGEPCIDVSWTYDDTIPNEKMRNKVSGVRVYPEPYGRGEWTAKTLEDARQMACDFASSVS